MSTIGYDSWAVDLADVGPVYPFQGSEVIMVVIGVVFWLGWHVIQYQREKVHLEKARKMGDPDQIARALERY
jgi:hypothetical protein